MSGRNSSTIDAEIKCGLEIFEDIQDLSEEELQKFVDDICSDPEVQKYIDELTKPFRGNSYTLTEFGWILC